MRLQETIAFYLLLGGGVAGAMLMNSARRTVVDRVFLAITASVFWPLYLPLLLTPSAVTDKPPADRNGPSDEMDAAIAEVNAELDSAMSSLDGWAENVLESERGRLAELRAALIAHAVRIRSMDALLVGSFVPNRANQINGAVPSNIESVGDLPATPGAQAASETGDRRRLSEAARCQNVARLAAVRRQSYDDLMATLAWIRELVSMIHLAKFTGAPASRAEELVAQVAAAVEGISAVAGQSADQPALENDSQPSETAFLGLTATSPKNRSIKTWASSNAPAT